jgi:HSP20 family molecular chaperone IbpA
MAKKEKRKKVEEKKDLEQLKKGIEQKGKEIEQLKKTIEEIRTQVQRKEKNGEVAELGKIFDNVSELLDVGFNIFGVSGKIQGGESKGKGLFGLVNDLAELAEKSEIHQKRVKLGEKGVIDLRIRSGPIRRSHATRSTGSLKISKPKKEISLERNPKLPTTGPTEQCEPIIDIFNEKDHIKVMAELPSVEENEINLDIEDNTLTISIDTPKRKYYRKLELPTCVKKDAVESNYRNGILEVKLKKAKNIKKTKKET